MKPVSFIENYRNSDPNAKDDLGNLISERYPNVDWRKALFEDYAMSYNANLNVSGGTKFVKYFAGVDFVSEGDLYKDFGNGRQYSTGYNYNRVSVRSNLDFNVTKNGIYNISPDVFLPKYSDGSWGFLPGSTNVDNGARSLALGGTETRTTTRINTDFVLEQQLDFITKGLSARGMIAWDNVVYKQPYEAYDRFDYTQGNKWTTNGGSVNNNATTRNLNYQLQLNYARSFGKHDVSAMGVFARQETAWGSMIPNYREDWVFRATYAYGGRYFLEYNGAYNGSEKFSSDNRFAFFNSGAIGWMISEEPFMKYLREKKIIDMLKIRASYGEIGDDNIQNARFLYMDQWAYGGNTSLDVTQGTSPYAWYRESTVGNPNVHWETVKKTNIGIDYGLFGGLLAGAIEFFHDKRSDILVRGSERAVPAYFGQSPVTANLGEVSTNGYEIEVRFNKVLANKMRIWANLSMTHAENKVKVKDDQPLLPEYRKAAGYPIGQTHAFIDKGMMQTYDDIYGSPKMDANDSQKLVGDYYIIDFNGDGKVDNVNDFVPYGHPTTPENTYNATIGFEWKGFNCFAQFYGVTNVTRDVTMISFADVMVANVYDQGTWWSTDHLNADIVTPRFNTTPYQSYYGTQYLCDGSFIRLKNVEVGYTFTQPWIRKAGVNSLKVFVSGNNLWLWTRMPDDRESNFAANGNAGNGAYPTMKRINLGIKINL